MNCQALKKRKFIKIYAWRNYYDEKEWIMIDETKLLWWKRMNDHRWEEITIHDVNYYNEANY